MRLQKFELGSPKLYRPWENGVRGKIPCGPVLAALYFSRLTCKLYSWAFDNKYYFSYFYLYNNIIYRSVGGFDFSKLYFILILYGYIMHIVLTTVYVRRLCFVLISFTTRCVWIKRFHFFLAIKQKWKLQLRNEKLRCSNLRAQLYSTQPCACGMFV